MSESIVYVHGVPDSGRVWAPFLARTGGSAPDLPGFGTSAKPADGDYTFRGLGRFVSELTAGMERFSLVVHDWGSVGLLAAMERPDAVDKLVVIDAVPFLPGYRWHRVARLWRTRGVGEIVMGLASRWGFERGLRMDGLEPAVAKQMVAEFWPHFDHGTQRAILRLYRSAPEDELARAGERLADIAARSLVVWGARDPYLPTDFARAYADVLRAELEIVDGAGHWPWVERPDVVDRVTGFLAG
jgi:pimeloyl-ACP methyl ester carboxylesterase